MKANRQNTDALTKGIGILNTFLDSVVDQLAAFETLTPECDEQEQQQVLTEAKELKTQCQQHLAAFTEVSQKQQPPPPESK